MFYGSNSKSVHPIEDEFGFILDQRHLYDLLSDIWCKESCAPRMRINWTKENKTLGQCSITAFLVQDIFGGEVYGVPLEDGNFHCFNVVGDVIFDLTSEQFQGKKLDYKKAIHQTRDEHFKKEEKYKRYLISNLNYLRRSLVSYNQVFYIKNKEKAMRYCEI